MLCDKRSVFDVFDKKDNNFFLNEIITLFVRKNYFYFIFFHSIEMNTKNRIWFETTR